MKRINYLFILLSFVVLTSCKNQLEREVRADNIPLQLKETVMLVDKFEYQDPIVYSPFYQINTDSLKKKTGFTFASGTGNAASEKEPVMKAHPLIIESNKHLEDYNKHLESVMSDYKGRYLLVERSKLESAPEYSNRSLYRYELVRKPVLHCYEDPDGKTRTDYKYIYYFHDRLESKDYPVIEVFSPSSFKSLSAIVSRLNRE